MSAAQGTVFIVDDDAAVRRSLGRLLNASGYCVETCESARAFLNRARGEGPACLVLDVAMPGMTGMELQQVLAENELGLPIVFITGHGDVPMSVKAMKSGAVDFFPKPVNGPSLLEAVRTALARSRETQKSRSERDDIRRRLAKLTSREREVLAHVVAGKLNKQIGVDLGIGEKTVKVHRGRVMKKMEVRSLADLVRLAEKAGLRLSPPA